MRSSKRKKRRTELFEDKRALGKILIEQCWVGRTEMLVVEEVKEEEEMKEEEEEEEEGEVKYLIKEAETNV